MKKIFLLLGALLLVIGEMKSTNLVVWSKDGTKVAYALSEQPKVTFTETELLVTTQSVEVNYPIDNMARLTYESGDETDIRDLKNDKMSFKKDGEALLFPALKANSTVSIYSLNGKLEFKKTVMTYGEYSFPLSNLSTGVYLVNVNGLTYKIVKK